MLSWLAPVIVFGLVVFVHELGHFLAAKFFGVYAPRFSIGFGPSLFKWRRGETEYKVGILPLGGYVRMASRLDEESAFMEGGSEEGATTKPKDFDPNAMIPFGPHPIPEDRWFESKPLYARLVIMLAGVFMNIVLGWTVNVGLAARYGENLSTKVSQVLADRPAARAGFKVGDSIVAIDGVQLTSWDSLLATVGRSTGQPLNIGIIREGTPLTIPVTPALDTLQHDVTGDTIITGKIGLAASTDGRRLPLSKAIRAGSERTVDMATLVFKSLRKLATREVSVSELGGPIAIAQASYESAKYGIQPLFSLLALISVNLAVFNLLPIPILDGGQIVIQIIESIRGRPLSDRAREYVARVGLAFILLLFVTVMFNDIKRIVLAWMA